ncbi:MAG TPA: iron-containing alcohol dehydrogenase, partial [Patescibacteria group bacterium]|nr:iron-containing alcohol dehydrogenase [Patescibacteria group bacterium]
NASDAAAAHAYQELALIAGICSSSDSPTTATEKLAVHLEQLLDLARLPRSLKDCGAHNGDLLKLADEASSQWTAQFNPRLVSKADFQRLYAQALT